MQTQSTEKKWLVATGLLWLGSVGLYAYDYYTGLQALLLLSLLHVFLEFPLNFRSVQGIIKSGAEILIKHKAQKA